MNDRRAQVRVRHIDVGSYISLTPMGKQFTVVDVDLLVGSLEITLRDYHRDVWSDTVLVFSDTGTYVWKAV